MHLGNSRDGSAVCMKRSSPQFVKESFGEKERSQMINTEQQRKTIACFTNAVANACRRNDWRLFLAAKLFTLQNFVRIIPDNNDAIRKPIIADRQNVHRATPFATKQI